MATTASLEELVEAVVQTSFSPGKEFIDSYLAPLGNNPRKSTDPADETTVHVFTDKHNKPAEMLMFLYTNKQPTITNRRGYTLLGEYFNLWMDSNTTSFAEDKLRGTRASLCCDFITPEFTDIPPAVIRNSVNSMKMLMKLQSETENRFNRFAPVSALNSSLIRPSITGQDAVVTVLNTPRLFNCDHMRLTNGKVDTDFDKDFTPPSVMKRSAAQAKALSLGIRDPVWLDDLPDSRGFYAASMDQHNARNCIFVVQPKVYDADGKFVDVTSYDAIIGDRQLVLAHCHLKMWHFEPNKQRNIGNHSRTYHVVINNLHLLRTTPDQRKRELVELVKSLSRRGNDPEGSLLSTGNSLGRDARGPELVPAGEASAAVHDTGGFVSSAPETMNKAAISGLSVSQTSVNTNERYGVGTEASTGVPSVDKLHQAAEENIEQTETESKFNHPVSSSSDQVAASSTKAVAESPDDAEPVRKLRPHSNTNGVSTSQEGAFSPAKRVADSPLSSAKPKQSRHK
ncbi:hypothetical protein PQX77_014775 [Marasmius sp. AFHP31]|nr:hypothetical protein PQX77_014775 [Marasmius sp. AFHP31]